MALHSISRRRLLTSGLTLAAGGWSLARVLAEEPAASAGRPPVTKPRATSGDDVHEPVWDELLTVTVGPTPDDAPKADLVGDSEKVIQAAVDYVARFGGGTVQLLPGKYTLRNSVWLDSRVRLIGGGAETVLVKAPSITTPLAEDSDVYDQEITVVDAAGFRLGDGICLESEGADGEVTVIKRTLVARSGNRFKLDRALRSNVWLAGKTSVSALYPMLTGRDNSADVLIENLTLDGNRGENAYFDGNYGGCVFLQDCNRYTLRNVEARNNNGDGISFQICHDVIVESCHSHGHAGLGLHPGSGSQRPIMRKCRLERNNLGLFFCWGVKYGLAEENVILDNETYGVSIGHNDTDNIVRNNQIERSGRAGVLFRNEDRGRDFWPHRNRIENNSIVDSGPESGIGIDIQGQTRDVVIADNDIRETRGAMKRIGVRVGAQVGKLTLSDNRFAGLSRDVVDERNG